VFGDGKASDAGEVKEQWEALKAKEKNDRGVLDGVPVAMPALLRALRVGEKAAHLGLDWPDAQGARDKLNEELRELDEAVESQNRQAIESELGDVLFALVSVARKFELDPEAALRRTLEGFGERVRWVEREAAQRNVVPAKLSFEELDALWQQAKEALRA
jgi:MazG family protein